MSDYSHLVGHRFPGGRFTLAPHVAWLWTDCAMSTPDSNVAHPSLAYLAAMKGSGLTIQEMFDLFGADADSGAMFGEVAMDWNGVLAPGETYQLEGVVTDVDRKHGRRVGTFDRVTFRLSGNRDGDDADPPLFAVTITFVFPRRGEVAA